MSYGSVPNNYQQQAAQYGIQQTPTQFGGIQQAPAQFGSIPQARPTYGAAPAPRSPDKTEFHHDDIDHEAIKKQAETKKSEKADTSVSIDALSGTIALELAQMKANKSGKTFGVVSLQASEFIATGDTRAPLDLVCVVDRSGSMSGSKIALVRHILKFVARQLQSADRLSIIEFDSSINVVCSLTRMSSAGQEKVVKCIEDVKARGGTDIAIGFETAVRCLAEREGAVNPITSIMLLTDGQDSSAAAKIDALFRDLPESTSVHTFGLGRDHDAKVMSAIAEKVHGTFTYIANDDEAGPAMVGVLGGLMTIKAQNIHVSLQAEDGYKIVAVHTNFDSKRADDGMSASVVLPDMFAEETRDIVIELSAQKADSKSDSSKVVRATISYEDPSLDGRQSFDIAAATVERVEKVQDEAKNVNIAVNIQRNRIVATDAMKRASDLAKMNELAEGRAVLASAIKEIEISMSADEEKVKALLQDLKTNKDNMKDRQQFESAGGYGNMRAQWSAAANQRAQVQAQPTSTAYGYNAVQSAMMSSYGSVPMS